MFFWKEIFHLNSNDYKTKPNNFRRIYELIIQTLFFEFVNPIENEEERVDSNETIL